MHTAFLYVLFRYLKISQNEQGRSQNLLEKIEKGEKNKKKKCEIDITCHWASEGNSAKNPMITSPSRGRNVFVETMWNFLLMYPLSPRSRRSPKFVIICDGTRISLVDHGKLSHLSDGTKLLMHCTYTNSQDFICEPLLADVILVT